MTVLGTRPEIIKLSRLIPLLDQHTEHILVHTDQNFDGRLSAVHFDQLGLRAPNFHLEINHKDGPVEAIADVLSKVDVLLKSELPDAFLVYGDTNSCMSVIAAKRRKVPVFHLEAGNRCFDQRVPEELNRKVIDHLSDVNMCLTEHARRNLIAEGLPADRTFVIGSPMPEVIDHYASRIGSRPTTHVWYKYILVSFHREENVDTQNLSKFSRILRALAAEYPDDRIVVSTHPKTKERLGFYGADWPAQIEFCEPFGWLDWVKLQQSARCVLSDSGSLTEEACYLGFPAVMLREQHERPEGQDAGAVIMAGLEPERVLEAVHVACELPAAQFMAAAYGNHQFSMAALRIILGYTEYVNRVVWHR